SADAPASPAGPGSAAPGGEASASLRSRPPKTWPISAEAPTVRTSPPRTRTAVHSHGATSTRNASTAGFNSGLPIQYASTAGNGTWLRRRLAATGAVQQVHIMNGIAASPPRNDDVAGPRPVSRRGTHAFGTSASISAAMISAATSAFHTAAL